MKLARKFIRYPSFDWSASWAPLLFAQYLGKRCPTRLFHYHRAAAYLCLPRSRWRSAGFSCFRYAPLMNVVVDPTADS